MKRRMEKEVEREAGQDLQIGRDPGEGLNAGGRSTKSLEEKFITREFNQYGGCHTKRAKAALQWVPMCLNMTTLLV